MTLPAKPRIPAVARRADAAMRMLTRELSAGQPTARTVAAAQAAASALRVRRTAAEQRAIDTYNRQAAAYNAAVIAQRNAAVAARQAKANAADAAKVRNAACPRCYATHPGEC